MTSLAQVYLSKFGMEKPEADTPCVECLHPFNFHQDGLCICCKVVAHLAYYYPISAIRILRVSSIKRVKFMLGPDGASVCKVCGKAQEEHYGEYYVNCTPRRPAKNILGCSCCGEESCACQPCGSCKLCKTHNPSCIPGSYCASCRGCALCKCCGVCGHIHDCVNCSNCNACKTHKPCACIMCACCGAASSSSICQQCQAITCTKCGRCLLHEDGLSCVCCSRIHTFGYKARLCREHCACQPCPDCLGCKLGTCVCAQDVPPTCDRCGKQLLKHDYGCPQVVTSHPGWSPACKPCHRCLRCTIHSCMCSVPQICTVCGDPVIQCGLNCHTHLTPDGYELDLPDLNIHTAMVDWYLLASIQDKYPDVYKKHTNMLADVFLRYSYLACGGEIRHAGKYVKYALFPPALRDRLEPATSVTRAAAWHVWNELAQEYTMPDLLQWQANTFRSSRLWNNVNVGGLAWARIAEQALAYAKGDISATMFVDMCWSTAHNGGQFFNKGWITHNSLQVLLTHAMRGNLKGISIYASEGVRELWLKTTGTSLDS